MENGLPVFNPEAKTIKEFKLIIERDRGGAKEKGDYDGRKKYRATKELSFIYFYCDYRSPYIDNYSISERVEPIKDALDLPNDWKIDDVVSEGIERYNREQETQTLKVLESSKESLFTTQKIITIIEKRLAGRILQIENDESILDSQPELIDKIIADGDRLQKLAKNLPDTIETLNKLSDKVKTELASEQFGRAGRKISKHELPD